MQINYNTYYPNNNYSINTGKPAFKSQPTLKYTNIGSCLEGYIGKVRLRNGSGNNETFMKVFKKYTGLNKENYTIRNDNDEILGEIDITINKINNASYGNYFSKEDPSHVFVDNLRNYSNPNTPYFKNCLEYTKDVGTRLLQIAQRRSDEAQCSGNIKLISKNESKNWYKNIIGMTEEFPIEQNSGFGFNIHNPNSMILPAHAKEPLSRLNGGL